MKTPFLGLRTCIFRVDELDKAKDWYRKAFNTEPYFDQPFYVGFNIAGFELGLQPEEKSALPKSDNVLCYWGVNDVNATFEQLINIGATVHEIPQNVGGEIIVASVKDPWQNVIGIIFNPEFKIA